MGVRTEAEEAPRPCVDTRWNLPHEAPGDTHFYQEEGFLALLLGDAHAKVFQLLGYFLDIFLYLIFQQWQGFLGKRWDIQIWTGNKNEATGLLTRVAARHM